ncbi:hypothetical protein N7509_013775, partial [Penicillium cosmopolitanum]
EATPNSITSKSPPTQLLPLHNSIPPELVSRFDPIYVEYYNKYNAGRLHTHEVPIEDYRKDPSRYTIAYGRAPGPDIFSITEQKYPENGLPKKRAAYLNFHGGGWVFGGLLVDHEFCKTIVDGLEGECVVFDVDYRLAPENPFPIPVEDCWAAFNWIREQKAKEFNLDPNRFTIGGASAGGHLAAVIAHLCRDANIPLKLQILTVPVCDMHNSFTADGHFDRDNCPYESYREMEFAPALPAARMAYFHRQFLGVPRPLASGDDWKISPILASNFENLAPALVSTAELDPLRDEGEVYAGKLQAAGNGVSLNRYKGAPHLIASLDGIMEGGQLYNRRVIAALKAVVDG